MFEYNLSVYLSRKGREKVKFLF